MTAPGVRPSDDFRLLGREVKYRGRIVTVSEEHLVLPNGVTMCHERIELPRAVAVVPLIEETPGVVEVVLVEQFRSSVRGFIHEIPAGILESDEDPADCARRELEEETGLVAGAVRHLATLRPLPGTSAHCMDFFLAERLTPGTQELEEGECLIVRRFALHDLLSGILHPADESGAGDEPRIVVDAKTHLGLLHVAMIRQREEGA